MDLDYFIDTENSLGINYYYPNIYEQLQTEDYDIVYVDNNNGIDDIKRNAALFRDAINWVNNPDNKTGTYPNVVMGISMGGLVARYALRKMEIDGEDHQTWKYITIDTPHKGANLPAGALAMIRHLSSVDLKFNGISLFSVSNLKPAKEVLTVLNSPAAKEMLIYNVAANGTTYDNSTHESFYSELEQLGLPTKTQNIAVTNGSLQDVNLFNPGSPIIACNERLGLNAGLELLNIFVASELSYFIMGNTNYGGAFLLNLIPGKTQLSIDFNVNGISSDPNAYLYFGRVRFHKKIFWLINSSVDLTNSSIKKQAGMLAIDGCAGGYESVYSSSIPTFIGKYIKTDKICFIPRESSLSMTLKDGYTTRNITGADLYALNETEFEHFSGPSYNSETHTTFNSFNSLIINQLRDKPVYISQFNKASCSPQTIILKNPLNISLNWTATNNAITFYSTNNTTAFISNIVNNGILNIYSENYFALRRKLKLQSIYFGISSYSNLQMIDNVGEYFKILPSNVDLWSYSGSLTVSGNATNYSWSQSGTSAFTSWSANGSTVNVYAKKPNVNLSLICTASNFCQSQSKTYSFTTWNMTMESVVLSPNPATSYTTVSISDEDSSNVSTLRSNSLTGDVGKYEIQLWNSYGLVKTVYADKKNYQFDLNGIPVGFYYIHVMKGDKMYRQQLIVK